MEPQRNEEGESSEVASAVDIVAETPQKPRQQPAWVEGLRHSSMDPSDDCRYYCPLCMMYFECVYETKCCGHTVCDECVEGLLETAGLGNDVEDDAGEMPIPLTPKCTSSKELPVPCPFCRKEGLTLKVITPGEAGDHLRNYEDSPSLANRPDATPSNRSSRNSGANTPSGGTWQPKPSPLKIGDSFEKMMSKMVPLDPRLEGSQPAGEPSSQQATHEKEKPRVTSGLPPRPPRVSNLAPIPDTTAVAANPAPAPGPVDNTNTGAAAGAVVGDGEQLRPDDEPPSNHNSGADESSEASSRQIPGAVNAGPDILPHTVTPNRERIDNVAMGTPIGVQPIEPIHESVQAVA